MNYSNLPTLQPFADVLSLELNRIVQSGESVAIAAFAQSGKLLYANKSMCYFLDTTKTELAPKNSFVNPDFSSLIASINNGLSYEGLVTIGNMRDKNNNLYVKLFRQQDVVLIIGEADVAVLNEDNLKMTELNQEINNLQRQLIKEKHTLQNTLAELKETQQMLIHSEKMNAMGKLVAGVAHEVNNPIAFVYSNLYSMEKYNAEVFETYKQIDSLIEQNGNAELKQQVSNLMQKNDIACLVDDIQDMTKESKTGVERVKTIVEDLRRFSRLDEADKKEIDLIENIHSTLNILHSEFAKKNIQFSESMPDKLRIECYPGQLNQAILNVLSNAVDAVENEGIIALSVVKEKEQVQLLFTDNGCGINPAIKQRIFDPFFTTKAVGSGVGLGLSITHKIICELHKGIIEINSSEGQGTEVKISIPIDTQRVKKTSL